MLHTRLRKTALHHTGVRARVNEVPQNFTEVYNVDDVSANDVIHMEKPTSQRKKKLEPHSNHWC